MQLTLPWSAPRGRGPGRQIEAGGRTFAVEVCRRRGARRYIVRVTADAVVRLTVPYGAPIAAGLAFATRQRDWIAREWRRQHEQARPWVAGDCCWFRGEQVPIVVRGSRVHLGELNLAACDAATPLRVIVEQELRALARRELPERCLALAAGAKLSVGRVSVRNQRSRWGACSTRGSITLNWRLVQVPERVRDYIIWHELAHLAVPNHSRHFWREVGRLYPVWREDEAWLKKNEREIL